MESGKNRVTECEKMRRREFLVQGGAAAAGVALLNNPLLAQAFPTRPGEEVISWADQPPPVPPAAAEVVKNLPRWEDLDSWLTPNNRFFNVAHYDRPAIDANTWSLDVTGLVRRPQSFTLDELKKLPRKEVIFTLECAGNHGFPWFPTGVGTAKWVGTPLAPILERAQVLDRGIEVVFFGSDAGEEVVRDIKMRQNFARSMSLADAMSPENLLAYEMNGAPLPAVNGFPLRLIAPGWYGVANVKWLKRIEVRDTRYMGRFMARDYVTIREEERGGQKIWVESSVGRALVKSAAARVTRQNGRYRIVGMAWGAPIARVEVRIDSGGWLPAAIDQTDNAQYAWKPWSFDWPNPNGGEHAITSRAIDAAGNVQPAPDDPRIAGKHTYWESNAQVVRRVRI
jgi:DMSO/TMAO reductase YedYZ molybdopterin-dependent catalytic subunit